MSRGHRICSGGAVDADLAVLHSQGETLDELNHNLKEVVELPLEDGEPDLETEFVGTQSVVVG